MKEKHEAKTSRDDVTQEKDEGGVARKKRGFLTKKEAEAASKEDIKHYRETVGKNMTNVPLRQLLILKN